MKKSLRKPDRQMQFAVVLWWLSIWHLYMGIAFYRRQYRYANVIVGFLLIGVYISTLLFFEYRRLKKNHQSITSMNEPSTPTLNLDKLRDMINQNGRQAYMYNQEVISRLHDDFLGTIRIYGSDSIKCAHRMEVFKRLVEHPNLEMAIQEEFTRIAAGYPSPQTSLQPTMLDLLNVTLYEEDLRIGLDLRNCLEQCSHKPLTQ